MAKLVKGDKFPDFKFKTQTGEYCSISELVDGKPTEILVVRYIGCPPCVYDAYCIQQKIDEFKAKGANVAVMMQSTPENASEYLEAHNLKLDFPIICDPYQTIYKALDIFPAESMEALMGGDEFAMKAQLKFAGMRDLGFEHGKYEGNEQQLPAFFHLDGDMNVIEAHYGRALVDIPTVDEMLEKL
ncbi:MAG: redoxin domain-containing protein [Oscillospiraceae bacterium]|jgi:peroxiredoxin|nr:redoxin domain-containing protein [Oscillospiraceae bacterium]